MSGVKKPLKLNHKLIVLMALFIIASVFMVYLFVQTLIRDVVYESILDSVYQSRVNQAVQLDELFRQHNIVIESISNILPLVRCEYYQDIIERAAYDFAYTKSFWIALEDGAFFSSTGWEPPEWFVNTERPWWVLSEASSGEVTITLPYASVETGRVTSTISRHIRDWNGQGGVAAANLEMDLFREMLLEFEREEGGVLILIGPGGEIIFHPNQNFMPVGSGFHYLFDSVPYSEALQQIESGENIARFIYDNDIPSYFMRFPLESVDWSLVAVVPTSVTSIPLQQTLMAQISATALTIALLAVVLFVLLRNRIIKPIESLTSGIEEISKNPSDVQVEKLEVDDRAMHRTDEVGELANAIDIMLRKVKISQELERLMTIKEKSNLILEATPWAVILYDNDLNPIDCNSQALEFFNYSEKDDFLPTIHANAALESINDEDGDSYIRKHLQIALRDGYSQIPEFPLTKEDGSTAMLELTLIRVSYGARFALLEYIRDITVKVEAETREKEAMHVQRLLYDSIPIPACLWNEALEVIDCNQAMLDFFKNPDKEDVLARFFEYSPQYQACGTPSTEKAKEVISAMITDDVVGRAQWAHLVNGETIPMEIVGTRFKMHDEYVCAAYALDMRLLESTIRLERELAREQERQMQDKDLSERIQAMLDATPLAVEIWDTDFNVIDCNKTTAELYGYASKQEFIDNFPEHKLRYGNELEVFLNNIKKAFDNGSNNFEFDDIDAFGNPMQIEVDAVCMFLNKTPVVISYTKNVTELKTAMAEMQRLEVVEESNRAKSRFLARMSHEIRTPISAVLGISEIELQGSNISMKMRESLTRINTAAERLLDIVNDLLDLSKLEAGKMEVFIEEYEVASMISSVTQMHPEYYANESIKFNLKVDTNTPALLVGDMLRIKQVLTNLLSNAFKYTASGAVDMSVRCVECDLDDETVLLNVTIADTGHGMTDEQVNMLKNNEYIRFHESGNREVSGTGLGMPVVFSLLSLMEATMVIESEVDVGTKISISIPQKLADVTEVIGKETALSLQNFEDAALIESKKFAFAPEPMPYGSVLVVDDVDANLYVARGLLAFYHIKVDTCEGGYEAIELIKQGKVYDIIFMDHMMQDINGIETMHIIRKMGYTNPIIALTANAMIGQAQDFIKKGFDGFVSKPIQTKILNAVLLKNIRDKYPPDVVSKARREYSWSDASDINEFQNSDELTNELRRDFVKKHTNSYSKLCEMIDSGDLASAHLLVHSLKGVAGLIKFMTLASVAFRVEKILDKGDVPPKVLLFELGNELDRIIMHIDEEIGGVSPLAESAILDIEASLALLNELEPLIKSHNVECLDFLDKVRMIPGSGELYEALSSLNFVQAISSLDDLKRKLI